MLENLSPELKTLILSMLPVSELRGAMPIATEIYKMHWLKAYFLSVFGNLIPVVPILLLLEPISKFLMRYSFFNKILTWFFEHTRKKSDVVEKYETLGLMIFVAIPLPATGAWTGCVAAFLFGIRFWYALGAISLGVVIAGIIVLTLIKMGYFGALIAAIAIIGVTAGSIYEILIKKRNREGRI